jgi:hypothetical protein
MHTVKAETPFGELIFQHSDGQITASGSDEALSYWRSLLRQGLYGAYGHIFQPEDCLLSDLTIALSEALGRDALSWNEAVTRQCKREMRALPEGVIP